MATLHMSVSEYNRQLAPKGEKLPKEKSGNKKPNKHRNKNVYVYADGFVSEIKADGHGELVTKYDSKKEYARHQELLLLERAGKISDLRMQKQMIIAEAFTDRHGKKHSAIVYRADFIYVEDGCTVVEDVKALDKRSGKYLTTAAFNIKWKLLQAKYRDYEFRLY